jgi:hypothetical protein
VVHSYHKKKRAIARNQIKTEAATAAVIYCYHNNKKRITLRDQLRPASLKDVINWLIGF